MCGTSPSPNWHAIAACASGMAALTPRSSPEPETWGPTSSPPPPPGTASSSSASGTGPHKVGSPDAQRFGGTCYSMHGAHIPVMVTTSTFTRQAVGYAIAQGIRLYDEHALGEWASQTGPAPWHQASVPAA